MNRELICKAFCQRLAIHEVPIGYVVRTPFRNKDDDPLAIYLRRADDGTYRLEDDGQTLAHLEAIGVDLDSETRYEAVVDLLKEYEAYIDERENVIHSKYLPECEIPSNVVRFSALLLRIFDLELLASTRVRSTFRDDLAALIEAQFGAECRIDYDAPLQGSMKDYLVDIIVRSKDGRSLAIFAGTSETRALESLLFWKEYREQNITSVRTFLMLESSKPRGIKDRTFSRVMNSGILLATMDGEEIAIRNKMRENLLQ
jgi:hypothetical protein